MDSKLTTSLPASMDQDNILYFERILMQRYHALYHAKIKSFQTGINHAFIQTYKKCSWHDLPLTQPHLSPPHPTQLTHGNLNQIVDMLHSIYNFTWLCHNIACSMTATLVYQRTHKRCHKTHIRLTGILHKIKHGETIPDCSLHFTVMESYLFFKNHPTHQMCLI